MSEGHLIYTLHKMLRARKNFAYGVQRDYFDHWDIVGWTREGDDTHLHSGIAVLVNNGQEGTKWMEVGAKHAGDVFYDFLQNRYDSVVINSNGWGEFKVNGGSVSVWVSQKIKESEE